MSCANWLWNDALQSAWETSSGFENAGRFDALRRPTQDGKLQSHHRSWLGFCPHWLQQLLFRTFACLFGQVWWCDRDYSKAAAKSNRKCKMQKSLRPTSHHKCYSSVTLNEVFCSFVVAVLSLFKKKIIFSSFCPWVSLRYFVAAHHLFPVLFSVECHISRNTQRLWQCFFSALANAAKGVQGQKEQKKSDRSSNCTIWLL